MRNWEKVIITIVFLGLVAFGFFLFRATSSSMPRLVGCSFAHSDEFLYFDCRDSKETLYRYDGEKFDKCKLPQDVKTLTSLSISEILKRNNMFLLFGYGFVAHRAIKSGVIVSNFSPHPLILSSKDGVIWNKENISGLSEEFTLNSVFPVNNGILITGEDQKGKLLAFYSENATNWDEIELPSETIENPFRFKNSLYFKEKEKNNLWVTSDGKKWKRILISPPLSEREREFFPINNYLYIFGQKNDKISIYRSPDLFYWEEADRGLSKEQFCNSVEQKMGGSLFLYCNSRSNEDFGSRLYLSKDGLHWQRFIPHKFFSKIFIEDFTIYKDKIYLITNGRYLYQIDFQGRWSKINMNI